ncbi:ATP-dependent Clp protease proteolytic subunit [Mucilaginibacter sp.]|uniref:ATP-dependent Clp protease proteolytic subunit n=1 Tax=Mucilaginibacter sp. TaxID=1882438 RepID=UPI0035BBF02C
MEMNKNEFRKYAVRHRHVQSLHLDKYISQVNTSLLPQGMTPHIMEERQLNISQMDVFSRLMMDRIIFLGTAIDDQVANIIQAQLLFLQSADAKRDIQIYINSPGGSVYAGFGIYDTMQFIAPDVATICTGMAASMSAVLLCAGASGKRAALPHSRVMLHQPSGGTQGPASDIEIAAREIARIKQELYEIIARHSGQPYEKVYTVSDRDHWMIAHEAKEFGIIDEVLGRTDAV